MLHASLCIFAGFIVIQSPRAAAAASRSICRRQRCARSRSLPRIPLINTNASYRRRIFAAYTSSPLIVACYRYSTHRLPLVALSSNECCHRCPHLTAMEILVKHALLLQRTIGDFLKDFTCSCPPTFHRCLQRPTSGVFLFPSNFVLNYVAAIRTNKNVGSITVHVLLVHRYWLAALCLASCLQATADRQVDWLQRLRIMASQSRKFARVLLGQVTRLSTLGE